MKNVVVLGCSGFIGRNICGYLAERGYHVTSVSHRKSDRKSGYAQKEIVFDLMHQGGGACHDEQ